MLMAIGLKDHQRNVLILQPSESTCAHETEDELLTAEGSAHLPRRLWISLHTQ